MPASASSPSRSNIRREPLTPFGLTVRDSEGDTVHLFAGLLEVIHVLPAAGLPDVDRSFKLIFMQIDYVFPVRHPRTRSRPRSATVGAEQLDCHLHGPFIGAMTQSGFPRIAW